MNESQFSQEQVADKLFTSYYVTMYSAAVACVIVTIGGNFLVLISFKFEKKIRTVSNYYIFSLALADMGVGLFSMSIYVFRLIVSTPPLDLAPVNPTLCYSYLTLDHLLTHVSIFNIIAIGIDRFLSIEDPMRYRAKRTSIKVKKVIVYVWLGCLIFWFAVVFVWPGVVKGFTYEQDYCTPFYETTPFGSILAALVYFWIPTPILFGLYVKLYQTSARMKQSMQANVVIAQPKIQVNHERRPTLSSVNLSSETKTGPNVVAKTAAAAAVELSGATIFVIANERAEDNIKSVFGNELNCSAMQGRLNLSSPVAIRRAPLSPLQKRVHKKLSCNGCSGERKASNSSSATSTRKISSMIDTVASMAEAQNKKAFKAFTFILASDGDHK